MNEVNEDAKEVERIYKMVAAISSANAVFEREFDASDEFALTQSGQDVSRKVDRFSHVKWSRSPSSACIGQGVADGRSKKGVQVKSGEMSSSSAHCTIARFVFLSIRGIMDSHDLVLSPAICFVLLCFIGEARMTTVGKSAFQFNRDFAKGQAPIV